MSTQLREILDPDSKDVLVLSSIVASRYYNFCTDDSTSHGDYGYPSYERSCKYLNILVDVQSHETAHK
jgi:hypothetical protein